MNDEITPVNPIDALARLREAWNRHVTYEEFSLEIGWSYPSVCKWAGYMKNPDNPRYRKPSLRACLDAARLLRYHGLEG